MHKPLTNGLCLVAIMLGTTGGALADQAGDDSAGGNSGQGAGAPHHMPGGFGQGGHRSGMGMRSAVPGPREVMGISSLTEDQKKKIEEIYRGMKEESQPLRQRMREMKMQMRSGGDGAGSPGEGRGPDGQSAGGFQPSEPIRALMQQMRAKREAAWTKVKPLLSDTQLKELEQAKSGQQRPGGQVPNGPASGNVGPRPEPDSEE